MIAKFVAIFVLLSGALGASTLVVSGDSNLGNGIDGSGGGTVDPGNPAFFSNLLGSGTNVVFQTTTNTDTTETSSEAAIVSFYTSAGDSVDQVSTITSADLTGANLLISFLPDLAYTSAEETAIQNFLNAGGTVLLTGEWEGFDPTAIANVNTLLTFLGSSMSLGSSSLDLGFHTATGGQIESTPFTAGVTSFEYAATTNVIGGTPIFLTSDLSDAFMAYTSTSTSPVPEPREGFLAVAGLGAMWFMRRRMARQ